MVGVTVVLAALRTGGLPRIPSFLKFCAVHRLTTQGDLEGEPSRQARERDKTLEAERLAQLKTSKERLLFRFYSPFPDILSATVYVPALPGGGVSLGRDQVVAPFFIE